LKGPAPLGHELAAWKVDAMELAVTSSAVPLVGALLRLLGRMALSRRSQRVAVLGRARLMRYELQTAIRTLEHALETGRWWRSTLRSPTWQREKATLVSALTDDELSDLHYGAVWLEFADRTARKRQRGLGRLRPMTAQDREYLQIALRMAHRANQTLLRLTQRKHKALRRAKRTRPTPHQT
jgi:hypothetical protein